MITAESFLPVFCMRIFLIKNRLKHKINVSSKSRSSSTLKIPEHLYLSMILRGMSLGGISRYLHHLLDKYRYLNYSGQLPLNDGAKTLYQEKGQNLKKVSFRPENEDWIELKLIAQTHGISATYLFVILLELDFGEFGDAVGDVFAGVDPTQILTRPLVFRQTLHKNTGVLVKRSKFGRQILKIPID